MHRNVADSSARALEDAGATTDLALRLLEGTPGCVKLIDLAGGLAAMNAHGLRLMEIDDFDAVCGAPWTSLWPEGERSRIEAAIQAAKAGRTTRLQAECPTAKGTPKWWEVTVAPLRKPSGEITHLFSTSYDVTPLKTRELELTRALEERHRLAISLAQQLEAETRRLTETQRRVSHSEKLRLLGQFVGNVVHDINNVLTVVQSASRTMRRQSDATSVLGVLDEVDKAIDRGVRLVRRLLDFSRSEGAAVEVFSPAESLKRDEDLLRHLAGDQAELVLALGLEDGPILAEPARFQSVLLNLVANARDAIADRGEIRIEVSACPPRERPRGLPAGDYVIVKVSDTGAGMTREAMRRAGEPFFTTKGEGKGTGLGLASTFEFAERCGGRVLIDSVRNRGTTISLYLPRAAARGDAVVSSGAEVDPTLHGRATLLVVEQDGLVREHLSTTLRDLGYVVLEASSAELALALELREMPLDLVISDLLLGSGGGLRLADRLRESRPDLPVIFLADASGIGAPERETVLHKPVSERGLAHAILERLGRLPRRAAS
jgi:signal transduction histidine kinase